MHISEKDSRFLKTWETTRINKWRYIVVRFVLLWGGLTAAFFYFIANVLNLVEAPGVTDFTIRVLFFMLIGFVVGNMQYEGLEKRYQELKKSTPNLQ